MDNERVTKCLLLDTLMYFDKIYITDYKEGSLNVANLVRNYLYQLENTDTNFIADDNAHMSKYRAICFLNTLVNNTKISSLKVIHFSRDNSSEKGPVYAAFADEKTKELFFSFRGTNGIEWIDNAQALAGYISPFQADAISFTYRILNEHPEFKDYTIISTGHSKGGNKAQIAAIFNPMISECYSFNGQGFSLDFCNHELISELIKKAKNKIYSICADRDFVNPLGICITDNVRFVETDNPIGQQELQKNYIEKTTGINPDSKSTIANNIYSSLYKKVRPHMIDASYSQESDSNIQLNPASDKNADTREKLHKISLSIMEKPREQREDYFKKIMHILQENTPSQSKLEKVVEAIPQIVDIYFKYLCAGKNILDSTFLNIENVQRQIMPSELRESLAGELNFKKKLNESILSNSALTERIEDYFKMHDAIPDTSFAEDRRVTDAISKFYKSSLPKGREDKLDEILAERKRRMFGSPLDGVKIGKKAETPKVLLSHLEMLKKPNTSEKGLEANSKAIKKSDDFTR